MIRYRILIAGAVVSVYFFTYNRNEYCTALFA